MSRYIRLRREGGLYFFTLVTHGRRPFLTSDLARACLREAWQTMRSRKSFDVVAVCILPDHLHCLWQLPENDNDFSGRWRKIKGDFTRLYLEKGGMEGPRTSSQIQKGERSVLQRRFYEHCIRDEEDLRRHFDYIHYNPVKHGLVRSVAEWPWSSFHRYVRQDWYDADWGLSPEMPDLDLD